MKLTVEEQLKSLREREARLLRDSDSARDWYVKDLVKYHFMNERTARRYVDDIAGIDGGLMIAQDTLKRVERETARDAEKGSKSTPLTDQQKKCPYCHEDICAGADPWVGRVGKDMLADDGQSQVYVSIEHPGHLMVVDYEGTTDSAPINYCPMCGRKLGGPK